MPKGLLFAGVLAVLSMAGVSFAAMSNPIQGAATPVEENSQSCCKHCSNSQACGDSCISWGKTCHKGPGCACQG